MMVLALMAAALVATRGQACEQFPQPTLPTQSIALEIDGAVHPLTVEVASTNSEKACGLMGRPPLGEGRGMLFDMRPGGPAFFWMENTPEPLDMIFIDPTGAVVHIEYDTVPFSRRLRGTQKEVAAVLELPAGTSQQLGLRLGDRVVLPWGR